MRLFDIFKKRIAKDNTAPVCKQDDLYHLQINDINIELQIKHADKDEQLCTNKTAGANVALKVKDEVVFDGKHMKIPKLGVFTSFYSMSKNQKYSVCGYDNVCIATEDNRVIFHRPFKSVNSVYGTDISNNGTFIVVDFLSPDNLINEVYIFNRENEQLFKKRINANVFNCAISENGLFACFQTCNNKHNPKDANLLFIVDIATISIISQFSPIIWANTYTFDEENNILTLNGQDYSYRYTFDGKFLDESLVEKQRIERAFKEQHGYLLKQIAFEQIEVLEHLNYSQEEDYADIINMLNVSLQKEMSDYEKASVYRRLGELYEKFNDKKMVLKYYEQAFEFYPKIGVKRKISLLKKELDITQ